MEQHFLLMSSAFLMVDAKIKSPAFANLRRNRTIIRLVVPFLIIWTLGVIGTIDDATTAYILVLGYIFLNIDMFSFLLKHDGYNAVFLCNNENNIALLVSAFPGKISSVEIRADGDSYISWESGAKDKMKSKVENPILSASRSRESILIVHLDENGHPAIEYMAPLMTNGSAPPESTWDHGDNKLDGFVSDYR